MESHNGVDGGCTQPVEIFFVASLDSPKNEDENRYEKKIGV